VSYADGRPDHVELPEGAGADPDGGRTVLLCREPRGPSADVTAADVARYLDGGAVNGAALGDVTPPFGAVHRRGDVTIAVTDWLGYRQLYWWQGDGVAAVSTSAPALGRLAGGGLDREALGVQSLLGWQLGLGTPFAGVTKLAPGCLAELRAGRVVVERYDSDRREPGRPLPEVVATGARLLKELLSGYVDDHPDAVLQLTGGHDSRILLGAISRERRTGLRTLTLDAPGGRDAAIAASLSNRYGMRHQVFDIASLAAMTPAEGYRLAVAAAADLGLAADPLALAPLSAAEARLEQGRRLSGLGGEVARGFYYGGQPAGRTSPALVERLARWRLFTNEAVDSAALDEGFAVAAQKYAVALLTEQLCGYSEDWLRALDEFYLWQRMHRWAGAHGTVAAVRRAFVNPMFDRRFIDLVRSVAPAEKRNSRLLGGLMVALDEELAGIPLDSGLLPAQLAVGRSARTANARKVIRKVAQRIGGRRRPPLGAALLAQRVVAHWRANPDLLTPVTDTGMVRATYVVELLEGRRETDPATAAFLLNLSVARTP
jgi:asparagine synthase (glutamine-hydrolysing)